MNRKHIPVPYVEIRDQNSHFKLIIMYDINSKVYVIHVYKFILVFSSPFGVGHKLWGYTISQNNQ